MSRYRQADYEPPLARLGEVAGVGWYSPAFLLALRKAGCDPAPQCVDWDAWFDRYQVTFVRLKDEGLRPFKVVIEPGDLARWLAARGVEHDLALHDEYVADKLRQMLTTLQLTPSGAPTSGDDETESP